MSDPEPQYHYTRSVLLQMSTIFLLLAAVAAWQWDVVQQIYLKNQINAIGWAINGGILLLFFCGLTVLVGRFFEYRGQEINIARLLHNVGQNHDPMIDVEPRCMLAERYQTLRDLKRRRAGINQNVLAATLLASESSRNSFLKFVHNVLILTGVFGTIVSLSLSLLGASDMIHATLPDASPPTGVASSSGLGAMIFGMSTALSTTMTAILAYLIFGYFYIKLTDTQTYLISRVEEATATTLLPMMQPTPEAASKDYAESIRDAAELIARFGESMQKHEGSVDALQQAAQALTRAADGQPPDAGQQDTAALLSTLGEQQQQSAASNHALLSEIIILLRQGFRLRPRDNFGDNMGDNAADDMRDNPGDNRHVDRHDAQ